jgi:Zn-dependent metalloprotease
MMGAMTVQSAQDNANLIAQLVSRRARDGLDSRHDFRLAQQHPGAGGTIISRADHTFKGVRIFNSESVVVTGPRGSIISESVSDRRSGLKHNDLDVTPAVSAKSAIDKVVRAVAPGGSHVQQPSAELIIYPLVKEVRVASAVNKAVADLNATDLEEVVTGYQLAYLVHTRMSTGNTPRFHDTIVSATDGSVLDQWSMVQTAAGADIAE